MKLIYILGMCISCIMFSCPLLAQKVDRLKLGQILKKIEAEHKVRFSYKVEDIDQYELPFDTKKRELHEKLNDLLSETRLGYQKIDDSHIAIIRTNYDGKKICGYLIDQKTKEVLSFATVSDEIGQNGTYTDEEGYFELVLSPEDEILVVKFLGYEDLTIPINNKAILSCPVYQLKSTSIEFETITVTEYLDDGITISEDANNVTMNPSQMSMLPGNVEAGVMASLQFLPGISSPGESLDGLHVRGGTPDQNLILWDDIPVYHSSHMFGSIAGFNPFIVEDVSIYRNGVSSRYGGRVSSVIDIKSKAKRPSEYRIGLGFNMTQLHAELEAPIGKNSALFLSSRNSLTEAWISPAFISYAEKVFQGSKVEVDSLRGVDNVVRFNDLSAKYVFNTSKNVFTIAALGSLNNIEYTTGFPFLNAFSLDQLSRQHGGLKLSWDRKWTESISSEIVATSTEFKNEYDLSYRLNEDPEDAPIFIKSNNTLLESGFRMGVLWKMSEYKKFNFGVHLTDNQIGLELMSRNFQMENTSMEDFESQLNAIYSEYSMEIPNLLKMDVGLRFQHSASLNNSYFEPRINFTTQITDKLKLKISTSKNFQFVSQLVVFDTNELGLGNEIWITANNTSIPVIEANQWTGGLFYSDGDWTIDGDAYVKELAGITSLSDSFDPEVNVPYATGTARISGIDILLKKRFGRYKSWLSYSLSKANYEFLSLSPETFPATYDQRHIIQWVHLLKHNKWEFSLGLSLKSGLPYTNTIGASNGNIVYDSLNGARLPGYFRLDGSIVYNIKQTDKIRSYAAFSFQNLGDRENLLSRQFITSEDGTGTPRIVTVDRVGLGLTPNISLNVWF